MGKRPPKPYNTRRNARKFGFIADDGSVAYFYNPTIIPKLRAKNPNGIIISQCRICGLWLEYPDDFVKHKGHPRKDGTRKRYYRRQCKLCWSKYQVITQRGSRQYKRYQRQYYLKRRATHNNYKKKPGYAPEHRIGYYKTKRIRSELPQLNHIGLGVE